MSSRRWWVIGSVLAMVMAVLLGWFVGVSPLLALAQADDEARAGVEAQNLIYDQQLTLLKTQFTGIDDLTAQLADLRTQLPPEADLPAYMTQLVNNAQANAVTLTTIAVSDAVKYDPVVLESAAAAPEETPATPTPTATPEPTVEATAAPTAGVPIANPLVTGDNFVAIPVVLTVDGDYANVLNFLDSMQMGTRLTTVTAFTTVPKVAVAAVDTAGEEDITAPVPTATVTGTISLYVYVLLGAPAAE